VVVGAATQIGVCVVKSLLQRNVKVEAVARLSSVFNAELRTTEESEREDADSKVRVERG